MVEFKGEIKQAKFQDNLEEAVLNVMFTSNWIRDHMSPFFKEYSILQQHYNVLRIVRGRKGKPVCPGEILEVMLDKGRDLTRLVDKLVKIGYLKRETRKENRRMVDIYITDYGLKVTEEIEKKINHWFNNNRNLSEDEAATLVKLLDKLRG